MKVTIVGLGLIGGSIAIDIRKAKFATEIIGVDINSKYIQEAQSLGLVDRILPEDKALNIADLVILAIPVNTLGALLPSILDTVRDNAVVIDAGSTKGQICKVVSNQSASFAFVAAHPLAGTENSGPAAAFAGLFSERRISLRTRKIFGAFDGRCGKIVRSSWYEHDLHGTG
ncbi:MAG: prephenate dehydrogenase/arogenate dehydrogenase family protein [Bacteroidota bacterium]